MSSLILSANEATDEKAQRLTADALSATRKLEGIRKELRASQEANAALRTQRDALQRQYDEAVAERFVLQSRIDNQEQQLALTFHRQPDSPARGPRGRRTATPYSRPPPARVWRSRLA